MWVLLNPHKTQREIAKDLGYTEAWVSTLMATDMFKEKMKELQETYHATAFIDVRSKTEAAANMALDRLIHVLENDRENKLTPTYILEATNKLLERFDKIQQAGQGAPQQAGGVTVNIGVAAEIQQALQSVNAARAQLPPLEHKDDPEPRGNGSYNEENPVIEPVPDSPSA